MFESMDKYFELGEAELATYSPLTLAYLGDCVYELVIRTMLVYQGNAPVNILNQKGSKYAKAATQAVIIEALFDELTEEEQAIYKRGRNAHSPTKAKNASMGEYRKASGFEALIGHLYLEHKFDRIMELIKKGFEHISKN